jgi:hypothetical protein
LATAIFARRLMPQCSTLLLDSARRLGAKILVSGGGRCNVTNRVVTAGDFCGGSPNVIRRVLAALPAERTVEFFREIGVEMYEEAETGKLFPTTDRAKSVLAALLDEAARVGLQILCDHRVNGIQSSGDGFQVSAGDANWSAKRVVLATGGQSLPKTGSDGFGYALAQRLGHSIVPLTPALDPLVLDGEFHKPLSGISQRVELTVTSAGTKPVRVRGILLWTHFGVSGPGVLDISRHWHRARVEGRAVALSVSFLPGGDAAGVERRLMDLAAELPKVHLHNALGRVLPVRVADAILVELGIAHATPMAHLSREARRRLAQALVAWPLPVRDGRGYAFAEATAGGVPLSEVDPRDLSSRKCPGLHLVGEILDVDGRIGGFNFQWAWSSAWVVATGIARQSRAELPDVDERLPPKEMPHKLDD